MAIRKLTIVTLVIFLVTLTVVVVSAAASDASSSQNRSTAFAAGLPDWYQVNSSGFGDPQGGKAVEVTALEAFKGYLYAGTHNPIDPAPLFDGAGIFRSPDGVTWNPVIPPGFGNTHDTAPPAILDFAVFKDYLYASTGLWNAAQIWRSPNGVNWDRVVNAGFGYPDIVNFTVLAEYGGALYVGATKQDSEVQIWRTLSGDGNLANWKKVAAGTAPAHVTGLAAFDVDGGLYAAIQSDNDAPAQIWRSYGGAAGSWETVVSNGFGNSNTILTGGMAAFNGYLYAGAGSTVNGALLYRTNDGTNWVQVISPASFGDPNNQQVEAVFVFENQLYASTRNTQTGIEVWRSWNGLQWEKANQDGFDGTNHNTGSNLSNAAAVFKGRPYVGTLNVMDVDGGELWRMVHPVYLPLILK